LRIVLVILVKVCRWYFKLITLHIRNPYSCNNAIVFPSVITSEEIFVTKAVLPSPNEGEGFG
jgi:hypothetical protein